jgi:hypothetical protein
MSPLAQAVEDYIQLRRGLGFKLKDYEDYLHKFVAFLEAQGSPHITTRLALDFATLPNHQKAVSWARHLGILRKFAIYRRNADPRTEVPPVGILPFRSRGAVPYLYSEEEIVRLMDAAGAIESPYSLQPWTYRCLFGLKLPRFDGHGNSNEKREPDGSKKETHNLSRGVSAPGGGNGDPQRQDAGPSGARTGVQRIQSESLEEGVFEATGAGRD